MSILINILIVLYIFLVVPILLPITLLALLLQQFTDTQLLYSLEDLFHYIPNKLETLK